MNTRVYDISKKITALDGSKIERKGKLTLAAPSDNTEIATLLGDNLHKFAMLGYTIFAQRSANNSLVSVGGSAEEKSLLRSFRQTVANMVEFMEMSQEAATKLCLEKKAFASLQSLFENLKDDGAVKLIDYSATYPIPRSFDPKNADGVADDEEENEEA